MAEIPPRKFYTTMPVLQIWNSTGTTLEHTIRFSERDNQPVCRWWPVKEYDADTVRLASGREVEYPLGWRLVGSIEFQVWPEGWTVDPRTPTVNPQVTEYEMALLMEASTRLQRVLFYPHSNQASPTYDGLRWVNLLRVEAPRMGLAQRRVAGVIEFRGVAPVLAADNVFKYWDAL